jgi:hypothetical protein
MDRRNVSSDGFMLNIASVLLDLCDPFLDSPQKVRRRRGVLTRRDEAQVSDGTAGQTVLTRVGRGASAL